MNTVRITWLMLFLASTLALDNEEERDSAPLRNQPPVFSHAPPLWPASFAFVSSPFTDRIPPLWHISSLQRIRDPFRAISIARKEFCQEVYSNPAGAHHTNPFWTVFDKSLLQDIIGEFLAPVSFPPPEEEPELTEANEGVLCLIGEFFRRRRSGEQENNLQEIDLQDEQLLQAMFEGFAQEGLIRKKDIQLYKDALFA